MHLFSKHSSTSHHAQPSSSNAQTEPNYRGAVEMSGWVLKYKAHFRTNHVKRYFRLNNSMLSNHPQLSGPATWQISVSKCIVKIVDHKNLVLVRLIDREIRFQLATNAEMVRWSTAIRSASVCNVRDFYKIAEQIGVGSYGAVNVAFDLATGEKRAVKMVKRTSNAKELEFVQREINVLLSINHPNIVHTYDIFDERDKIFVVMDFVSGGDLFDYISARGKLDEQECKRVMWQILQGICYLHDNHIVHRDIKPENVLVTNKNPLHLQLTDFGFANFIDPHSTAPQTDMTSIVGTGCYMAPEVMDSRGHGRPVDIFAVGVLMFRVLSGRMPFRGMTLPDCYEQAVGEKADLNSREWRGVCKEAKMLCRSMLRADPALRPTGETALANEWFTSDQQFMTEMSHIGTPRLLAHRKMKVIDVDSQSSPTKINAPTW